ncbi:MAG: S8 family serine peptidase [Fibrobacterota bacterium]
MPSLLFRSTLILVMVLAMLVFPQEGIDRVWVNLAPDKVRASDTASLASAEAQLNRLGFRRDYVSRWLNALSGRLPSNATAGVARLPFVRSVEPVGVYRYRGSRPLAAPLKKTAADPYYGNSREALDLMGVPRLFDEGRLPLDSAGKGVRIAVIDAGFRLDHAAFSHFSDSTLLGKRDYAAHITNPAIPFDTSLADDSLDFPGEEEHGTKVLSLIAAHLPGTLMGVAPFAQFLLIKTERVRSLSGADYEGVAEEDAWIAAVEWAVDSVGVDIITTSLGYRYGFTDGRPDYPLSALTGDSVPITRAANIAASKGVVVFAAVGNEGRYGVSSLSVPSDGDSVMAVGATDPVGAIASFTSYGPTAKGRRKPDISAPGDNVYTANLPAGVISGGGTSFATPMAAGACALLLQAEPALKGNPVAVRARLSETAYIPSAVSTAMRADSRYGAGIIHAYAAVTLRSVAEAYHNTNFWIACQPASRGRALFIMDMSDLSYGELTGARLTVSIYTLSGSLLRHITKKWPDLHAGRNALVWDTRNDAGKQVAPGIYMVSTDYKAGGETKTFLRKLALIP